jgi:hypothetical protein
MYPMNKSLLRWLAQGAALLGLLAGGGSVLAASTPYQTISDPAGLLTIFLGNELGMQVLHSGDDTEDETFPADSVPGDFGTFVFIENDGLYGPDFSNHGGSMSAAVGRLRSNTPFTPDSQSPVVTGTGTGSDPYTVVTEVKAGNTVRIKQTVTYVAGEESFTTRTEVFNDDPVNPQTVLLYRAMDCYLGGSDKGYGYVSGNTVACTKNANNTPPDRVEFMTALTPDGHYTEGQYTDIWDVIDAHMPFDDTCDCGVTEDNALGYSWSLTVPPGSSVSVADVTGFSPSGRALPINGNAGMKTVPATSHEALAVLALLMTLLAAWAVRARQRRI